MTAHQIMMREREHTRVRGIATRAKPVRRVQLASGVLPDLAIGHSDDAERAEPEAGAQ